MIVHQVWTGTDAHVMLADGAMWTVCGSCGVFGCEIVDGVAPRFCPECVKAGRS